MPRDAEAWLADQGVRRERIHVAPSPSPGEPTDQVVAGSEPSTPEQEPANNGGRAAQDGPPGTHAVSEVQALGEGGPPLSVRDAGRLAAQAAADAALRQADAETTPDPGVRRLEDDVAEAVAFVRRSTASAPQSEGRVRDKLLERGWQTAVVDQAMERARRERLVDDTAMVAALVDERLRKGHAPPRIRRDLRSRGFTDAVLDDALASAEAQDLESAAFAVAMDKAARCTGLAADAAFRRVVGHVARRGYPEGLARKVAREAVFTTRDDERTVGH